MTEKPVHQLAMSARVTRRLRRLPGKFRARKLGARGRRVYLERPQLLTRPERIGVGSDVYIRTGARLECICANPAAVPGRITIGSNCGIEGGVHIGAAYEVRIGFGVLIASGVTIMDHDHGVPDDVNGTPIQELPLAGAPIEIGNAVWIGERAAILKGVTIGDCAIVGAGAVVTRSVPPGHVALGVPARSRPRSVDTGE